MAFPTTIDSFTTKVDNVDDVQAAHVNDLQTAVVAIETKLGIDDDTAVFYPLATALTSTSWDGDSKGVGDNGIIDLSAVFSAPAGIKAVLLYVAIQEETPGEAMTIKPTSGGASAMVLRCQVANIFNDQNGICACDSNGDIYVSFTSTLTSVYLNILGYWK